MAKQVTVKSGDTLSGIAAANGVNINSISGYKSGNPNLIYPGEVLNIGDPSPSINAANIKPTTNLNLPTQSTKASTGVSSVISDSGSVTGQVDKYRKLLDSTIANQKSTVEKQIKDLEKKNATTLDTMQTLTTPFRADLEAKQREELYINQNFEDNQKLINELDTLLTQGNDLIKQEQQVTGLSAVRNPRIQQTMTDIAARKGVIEAVINARNGQIAVAENLIDRSVNAIAADRQDQLTYYNKVLDLNRQDLISLTTQDRKLADEQVALIQSDLERATKTADYVKQLMVDPATASLMGEAGVSLNDSVETINAKLKTAQGNADLRKFSNDIGLKGGVAVVDPTGIPANQLVTYTDANGGKHYYKIPATTNSSTVLDASDPRVTAWVNSIKAGNATMAQVPADLKTSVANALGSVSVISDADVGKALTVLQEVDIQTYGTADKQLSTQEIQDAYNKLLTQTGNADTALNLLKKAMDTGGYSEWKG